MFTIEKAKIEQVNEIIEEATSTWHDPEILKQQIRDPKVYFAVAKDEKGKVVGIITVRRIENNETLQLDRLYIHPSYQNKGIGRKLFNEAIAEFKGITTIFVDIEEMNKKAIEFYRKQGFEDFDTSVETIGDKIVKVKEMIKKL